MNKFVYFGMLLLFPFMAGNAQQTSTAQIPTDPKVRIGKLENGITYYLRHNDLPEKQAEFYIAQKVGSILEEDNQQGLAHFLEHMCFNGTKNFPGKKMIQYLESIGVKFGANLNAYTSIDETVYNISNVPLIRESIADSCLLILHDWANALSLEEKEIDSERGVIHEEWRTRQSGQMRAMEKALPIVYQGDRYAYRMPIGKMSVVDHFPYKALRDYYEKWYRPDLQGILVVGDIDVDKMEQKIKKLFGPIKMPKNPATRTYFPVKDNVEPIISIETDKELSTPNIYIMHKLKPMDIQMKNTEFGFKDSFMKVMISSMLNMRLAEITKKPGCPFIGAQSGFEDFLLSKNVEAFNNMAVCTEQGVAKAFEAILTENERAYRFGFTEAEYERAKAQYKQMMNNAFNERNKTRSNQYVGEYVRNFLNGEPIPGIEKEYAISMKLMNETTLAEVNALYKELDSSNNMVVMITAPEKEGVTYPTADELKAVIKKVKNGQLNAYEDKLANKPLIANLPSGGKIVKTESSIFGTTLLTLSNGVRVFLKPTDFQADRILMASYSPGGSCQFDTKDALQIKMLNSIISLGGLGDFSEIELNKVLAGKQASVGSEVDDFDESVHGTCAPKDLETMLQLTYLSFTSPRMDQEAFTSFKERVKPALEAQAKLPKTIYNDSINAAIYMKNPLTTSIKSEDLDKLDYARIMEMYKDRFKDASDFTFYFIGNIDLAKATPLIERYLGSLPSINRKENWKDNGIHRRNGLYTNVFTLAQETPKSTVSITIHGKMKINLRNQILMSMLQQSLNTIYLEEVREKEGGTYGVSVRGNTQRRPVNKGIISINFDTDPDKQEKMVDIVLKQIDNFIAQGPKAEDLNKYKEYMIKNHKENLKNNNYWLGVIMQKDCFDMDSCTDYEKTVNSITGKDLQKFTKALTSQKNCIEVIMTTGETKK